MSVSGSAAYESALIAVRLMAIRYAAQDTHVFEFAPVAGGVLPAAAPGAHIDLHLPGGAAGGRVRAAGAASSISRTESSAARTSSTYAPSWPRLSRAAAASGQARFR